MANSVGFSSITSIVTPQKPGILISRSFVARRISLVNEGQQHSLRNTRFPSIKATKEDEPAAEPAATKVRTLVCQDCEGNGNILCSQCKGNGVNDKDHFGGRFKEGGLCWLCRGKREILCGSCNGAGFMGGFMSTGEG